ncbi:hypothetical protein C8Q79DRAFT_913585 [Trametes meyenii]|nr:hypothetical protein C8Q79DRAFT_913585 [Trametes meyenii]
MDTSQPISASLLANVPTTPLNLYSPLRNGSEFNLLNWQYKHSGATSNIAVNDLVNTVILDPDFSVDNFRGGFTIENAQARLDKGLREAEDATPFTPHDGWIKTSVKIRVPKEGVKHKSEEDAPEFEVPNVFYRPLLNVVMAAFQSPSAANYHYIPHKLFCRPNARQHPEHRRPPSASPRKDIRMYTDYYNSDAMLEEDAAMRAQPRQPGDPPDLAEYALAALCIWSDSTHLTQFGSASAWPIYAYVCNESKYIRGRPTSFSAQHLAYVPSLPDSFQDWYRAIYGVAATAAVLTFCKRELMQAVWKLLLSPEFIRAYEIGIVLTCGDAIMRRLFLRLLTYSADYPEKMLLTCLRYFANCPCPRCLIIKQRIGEMGTLNDFHRRSKLREDNVDVQWRIRSARKWIFEGGIPLTSVFIKRVLDDQSLTPTRSAFSLALAHTGFNFYSMFVPDLLHEFELGVWKSTLTHLIRILYAAGGDRVQEFNRRYIFVNFYLFTLC